MGAPAINRKKKRGAAVFILAAGEAGMPEMDR